MIDDRYEYFAFISYKEEDADWAKWLQRKLEHYKLPTALRKAKPHLPERIGPIYEYKSEAGGGRLKEVIWKGLTSSKHLIVICSPRSGGDKSRWLNDGIRYFVESGREENIIPFIVEGRPRAGNPEEECFPTELLKLTDDRELRGINVNEMGRDAAAVKVAAGMLEMKFDTLWRRYERERSRRRTIVWASAGFLAMLLMASVWIFQSNRQLRNSNLKIQKVQSRFIAEKVNDLIGEGDAYTATLLALEALPGNQDRPYVTEAEYALRQVMAHGSALLRLPEGNVRATAFSPDGQWVLAVCSDDRVRAWDAATGALLDTVVSSPVDTTLCRYGDREVFKMNDNVVGLTRHDEQMWLQMWKADTISVGCVALSPDGSMAAQGAADGSLRIRSTADGRQAGCVETAHRGAIRSVAFSADGKRLVTASADGTAKIWDSSLRRQPLVLKGHTKKVFVAKYSVDERAVVTASEDSTMRLWSSDTGQCLAILRGHHGAVRDACFSPDGKMLASAAYDNEIWLWDMETLRPVKKLKGHASAVCSVCFSPDGRLLASTSWDNTIKLWNLHTGAIVREWTAHRRGIHTVRFSPDGKTIASASWENNAKIWDAATGRIVHELKGHKKLVTSVSFFPHGHALITSSEDGTVRTWDFSPLQQLIDDTRERFRNRRLTHEERQEYYLE